MGTAKTFLELVDSFGEDVPAEVIASYRQLFESVNEETQQAFLDGVADHLTWRLSEERTDAVARSGRLLSEWFLTPGM
jgi:hypothetical protein